jgi:hypothetical protein
MDCGWLKSNSHRVCVSEQQQQKKDKMAMTLLYVSRKEFVFVSFVVPPPRGFDTKRARSSAISCGGALFLATSVFYDNNNKLSNCSIPIR